MKTINQIFENDKTIMNNSAVIELIEYCEKLEDENIEFKQSSDKSFEDKLTILVNEIYQSVDKTLKDDEDAERFKEIAHIDFKQTLKNLKKYLEDFSRYNRFYFD